jgi:alpha-L-fucosidase
MSIRSARLAITLLAVTTLFGGPAPLAVAGTSTAPSGPGTNYATDDPFTASRTQWWRDARFGQFIHFGAYSQLQGQYTRTDGTICRSAEWIQRDCGIPKATYEQIAAGFNPASFDAEKIASDAAAAGQKYIVITAKHHEGYAMWPTKQNTWNLRDHSSFDTSRDILAELKAASDRHGVKFGVYYSIWDWHDPDFPDPATFGKYKTRMYAQLKELIDNYHPAVLWFDGQWDTTNPYNPWTHRDGEELEAYLRDLDPNLVINNRVGKGTVVDGDHGTPEQEIPSAPVDGQLWESCMTINDHWGFASYDTNWKSTTDLTRKLVSIAGRSGNFLLNVGPDKNGTVPQASVDRLHGMGDWLNANGQGAAVYGARTPGLVSEPSWGSVSRAGDKLYASVFNWPGAGNTLTLNALSSFGVTSARVLGSTQSVTATRSGNTISITPSGNAVSAIATVIELTVSPPAPAASPGGTGLSAQFWPNTTFSGTPAVTRTDAGVNYNWRYTGSPDASIGSDAFSSRWTGTLVPRFSETYTFTTVSDDTVRLWIDNQLVIGNTTPHAGTVDKGTITLTAGRRYAIELEQTEQGGAAVMKLIWTSPNTPQQIVPASQLLPDTTTTGPAAGHTYTLKSVSSGLVVQVDQASTADGAKVVQGTATGGGAEKWKLADSNGGFSLAATHSGKCMDVNGGSTAAGATIIQWGCHGGTNQAWKFTQTADGSYTLTSVRSGLCLDVPGSSTATGTQLIQWTCHGGTNQRWILTETP